MFTARSWEFDPSTRIEPTMPIMIEARRQMDGSILYAITQVGACFSRNGEWEHEPIPSSRDDEYISRCRYDSWEDAAKMCERHFTAKPWGRIEQNRPSKGTQ